MHVVVVSDTHAPTRWRGIPPPLVASLERADVILHAGDVCRTSVLDELARYAPVHVVLGNNDDETITAWGATFRALLDLDGLAVGMIHDSGSATGRDRRMRAFFPEADLVVFGHSHIPLDEPGGAVHLFNPGSPSDPRRQPLPTYGELTIDSGRLVDSRIVSFPRPDRR